MMGHFFMISFSEKSAFFEIQGDVFFTSRYYLLTTQDYLHTQSFRATFELRSQSKFMYFYDCSDDRTILFDRDFIF